MWGSWPPLHTPYYVMMPYIIKKSFPLLLVEVSLFGQILLALHLLDHVAFRIVLVAYEMCLLACG